MSKLLLYCTKAKKQKDLLWSNNLKHFFLDGSYNRLIDNLPEYLLNGKIVAECDFDVEEIDFASERFYENDIEKYNIEINKQNELLKRSCLTATQIVCYLDKKGKGQTNLKGYAIHIKNLHIFDTPKELSDYYKFGGIYNDINNWKTIDKAPQNMMYAYDLISELGFSGTYNSHFEKNILISIKPEWLCKILNGEKTIEVRKQIVRELKE